MAHIDALIDKVSDPALRQMLREQIDIMLNKQSFGLVYQQHKPETVELWHYGVLELVVDGNHSRPPEAAGTTSRHL